MALDNLRDFLRALDARGELVHVGHPVSVDKEITEIADRCMKSPGGGPALLFEHPTLPSGGPARYPVAVNLFGSEKRMALALGVECLDEVGERIATLLNMKVPDSLLGKLAMRSEEHTSELQSRLHLVCRLLLEKKKKNQ